MKRLTMILVALTAVSFVLLFSGCGQSGALYIPGNPSQMAVPPDGESKTEEEQENDDSSAPE